MDRLLLRGALALLVGGCALFGPPSWVERSPVDDEYLYGVGSAGVTFDADPSRSQEIARQRALDELERQIRLQASSTPELGNSRISSVIQGDQILFTDEDADGIELVEVWVDAWGRAGKPHQTYVLLRLPRERVRAIAARPR